MKESVSQRLLFEMFYDRVYNTAYFMTKDTYLAQDIAQETFIKAFKQLHTLKDGTKLEAWLNVITVRTSIDFLRKVKSWNDFAADDVYIIEELTKKQGNDSPVEKIVELNFIQDEIDKALDKLSPDNKQIMLLKYRLGLSDKEIAEEVNLKVGTVKSRLHRLKDSMKRSLDKLNREVGDS